MAIKSNKDQSLGTLYDKGTTKEELMRIFCLSEPEYERKLASLKEIRARAAEKQKKGAQ